MIKSIRNLLALSSLTFAALVSAQDGFPSRPVKMIVPYPAGGGGDILARAIADVFQKNTGQPMIIENKAGANGMVGAAACKSAPPDGYTYCLPVSDVMAINPHIYKKVPYDVERDFTVVTSVATVVLAIVTNSSVPAKDLRELASWSQVNSQKANFATWGIGSAAHLMLAQFNKSMSGNFTNVPYTGVPQMLQATLAGDAASTLLFFGPIAQFINDGKLRPLAVLANERYSAMPNVPTVSEAGFSFTPTVYYGVYAPVATPPSIVAKMGQLISQATSDPAVLKTMNAAGFTPLNESPKAFGERVVRDRAAWGPVAKSLGLALE